MAKTLLLVRNDIDLNFGKHKTDQCRLISRNIIIAMEGQLLEIIVCFSYISFYHADGMFLVEH